MRPGNVPPSLDNQLGIGFQFGEYPNASAAVSPSIFNTNRTLPTMTGATHEDLSNGHMPRPPAELDDSAAPPTEAEVQTIIQTIRDASSAPTDAGPTSPPRRTDSPLQEADPFDEGAYWDLSSMAPLNAVSAVS